MRFLPLLLLAGCASNLDAMYDSVGMSAWDGVERIRFTCHHLGKDVKRTHDWKKSDGRFPGDDEAFVNDSYWFLFEYLIRDDDSTKRELGRTAVPGFPQLGERRAIEVDYRGGDRYVLYLGDDGIPVAWAFHKAGAEAPTLVTTRGKRGDFGGLPLPTEFAKADGTVVIRIEDIGIER